MFISLLLITLLVAMVVSSAVTWLFNQPIANILNRIIADEISVAWVKYLKFAIFVVGVSSGVRIYDLERYITPNAWDKDAKVLVLTDRKSVV